MQLPLFFCTCAPCGGARHDKQVLTGTKPRLLPVFMVHLSCLVLHALSVWLTLTLSLLAAYSLYWLPTAVLDLILAHPACRSKHPGLCPATSHSYDGPLQDNCWGQPVARSGAIQHPHRPLRRILDNSPLVRCADPCHIRANPRPFSEEFPCEIPAQRRK